MITVLQIVHVLNAFILVLIVLLQQGKGAGMGLAFGGTSTSSVFGGAGAGNFLTKVTAWAAVIFMATSLSLAYMSGRSSTSLMKGMAPAAAGKPAGGAVTAPADSVTGPAAPAPATK